MLGGKTASMLDNQITKSIVLFQGINSIFVKTRMVEYEIGKNSSTLQTYKDSYNDLF